MAAAHSLQVRTLNGCTTLNRGQCCDLKIENHLLGYRWWICRLPIGKTEHRITVEKYNGETGEWETERVFTDQEEQ